MENNAAQSNNIQQLNTSIDMQLSTLHNQTQQLSNSNTMLQQQLTTLHNQTQQLSDSNTMLQHQLTTLHNQTQQLENITIHIHNELLRNPFSFNPAASCAALPPSSPSGYYWISASNGSPTLVYCTMSCGAYTGGWMRVGFLNRSHQCPSGLMERNYSSNIRTCVRDEESDGCSSVELSTANIQYSTVCGRITAYQVGTVDGFINNANLNSAYVDGVSLTHGSPRLHIWTFAASNGICNNCHDNRRSTTVSSSVGSDFFCDSGNYQGTGSLLTFYGANPLWDGVRCTGSNNCCPTEDPSYFIKTIESTTDDIEMRVCRNEGRDNEDIAIETVEIYVQ